MISIFPSGRGLTFRYGRSPCQSGSNRRPKFASLLDIWDIWPLFLAFEISTIADYILMGGDLKEQRLRKYSDASPTTTCTSHFRESFSGSKLPFVFTAMSTRLDSLKFDCDSYPWVLYVLKKKPGWFCRVNVVDVNKSWRHALGNSQQCWQINLTCHIEYAGIVHWSKET